VSCEDWGSSDDQWSIYKEHELHGRIQVLLEGIKFCGKESGFVGRNQIWLAALEIWCDKSTIREYVGGCVHSLIRFGFIME
jgi:hypothetical protein